MRESDGRPGPTDQSEAAAETQYTLMCSTPRVAFLRYDLSLVRAPKAVVEVVLPRIFTSLKHRLVWHREVDNHPNDIGHLQDSQDDLCIWNITVVIAHLKRPLGSRRYHLETVQVPVTLGERRNPPSHVRADHLRRSATGDSICILRQQ